MSSSGLATEIGAPIPAFSSHAAKELSCCARSVNGYPTFSKRPAATARVGEALLDDAQRLETASRRRDRRQTGGDAVVAPRAQDLLDEVVLPADVVAGRRDRDRDSLSARLGREPEPRKRVAREVERDRRVASEEMQPREPEGRAAGLHRGSPRIEEPGRKRSARAAQDEVGREVQRGRNRGDVRAPLEPVRRVRVHPEPARGPADRGGVPPRGLQEHMARRGRHGGVEPAHDPGERDGALRVRHDDVGSLQAPLDSVEGDEGLAPPCLAHDDRPASQLLEVEGMERLAERPEPVVRRVDGRADRVASDRRQPAADELGRGRVGNSAEQKGAEPQAVLRALDAEGRERLDRLAGGGGERKLRSERRERSCRERRDFPGEAGVAHRVRAVRRDLDVEDVSARAALDEFHG